MEYLQPIEVVDIMFWDEDEEKFYDMGFTACFSQTKIKLSIPSMNFNTEMELPSGKILPVSIDKKSDTKTIVHISNAIFLMSYVQAVRVEKYYNSINEQTEKEIEDECNKVNSICDYLNNEVYFMAENVLKLTDDKILINHDAVILLQRLFSSNKIDNIEFYDTNIFNNNDFTYYVTPLYEAIENYADLLEEENFVETEYKKSVAWELVKRVSIPHYSNIWKTSYEKYIDEPLRKNDNPEAKADGTLDRYIETIILCNEINHKSEEVLAYFTYFMMDKGYSVGTQYFPAYFDMCKQAFDVIGDNLRKNSFKNKLKGINEKKEIHYSIDDIDMMNGSEFEQFVSLLYSKMGYSAEVTKHSGDQGIDVIAEKNNIKVGIQAKCYSNSVGNSAIQEAVAGKNYYNCDKVIVVTNNSFTNSAIELAQVNDVILWDRNILKEKISELF